MSMRAAARDFERRLDDIYDRQSQCMDLTLATIFSYMSSNSFLSLELIFTLPFAPSGITSITDEIGLFVIPAAPSSSLLCTVTRTARSPPRRESARA